MLTALYATSLSEYGVLPVIAAVCAILGHSKSVFLESYRWKIRCTGVGTLMALNWQAGLIYSGCLGYCNLVSWHVSLGSISALALSPFNYVVFKRSCCLHCLRSTCGSLCYISSQRKILKDLKKVAKTRSVKLFTYFFGKSLQVLLCRMTFDIGRPCGTGVRHFVLRHFLIISSICHIESFVLAFTAALQDVVIRIFLPDYQCRLLYYPKYLLKCLLIGFCQ